MVASRFQAAPFADRAGPSGRWAERLPCLTISNDDPLLVASQLQECGILRVGPAPTRRHGLCRCLPAAGYPPPSAAIPGQAAVSWFTTSSRTRSSSEAAANARACRMSSSSSSGNSRRSSARSGYNATSSTTRRTVSRRLRTQGCPFIRAGLLVIRSNIVGPLNDSRRFVASCILSRAFPTAHVTAERKGELYSGNRIVRNELRPEWH